MGERRKYRWRILPLILWCMVIFWFSQQDGDASAQLSDGLTMQVLRRILPGISDLSVAAQAEVLGLFTYIVRKVAHFTEYAILGMLAWFAFRPWVVSVKRTAFLAWIFAVVYACTDEFHQMFRGGRTPQFMDIGIDSLGALFGIALIVVVRIVYLYSREKEGIQK